MGGHTRRGFLSLVLASAMTSLGDRSSLGSHPTDIDFPSPHLIDPRRSDWVDERPEMTDGRDLDVEPENGEAFVERLWDPRSGVTEAVNTIEVPADLDDRDTVEETVSLLYRKSADGELRYLFDFGVSEAHWRDAWSGSNDDHGEKFDRSFDEFGATVSCHVESTVDSTLTVEVPYSLYANDSTRTANQPLSVLPVPGGNDFDLRTHAPLVDGVGDIFDGYEAERTEGLSAFQRVAVIAELVQSIPHETDWDSERSVSFLRSPEATLVELTADCKDASLLLYHLLEAFDFSPVFVYLVGDMLRDPLERMWESTVDSGGSEDDKKEEADEKVQYPNHLAVAIPLEEMSPIPTPVADEIEPLEYDGTEYAYIESTDTQPPGVGYDDQSEMTPILYENRREFVEAFVPLR